MRCTLIGLALVLLTACTNVGVVKTVDDIQPRPKDCELEIIPDGQEIERAHTIVCLIDVKTGTSIWHDTTGAGAVNYARPHACQCGADAMIVLSATQEGDGVLYSKTGVANLRAIRYDEGEPQ